MDIRDAICRYKFTPSYVRWIAKLAERYVYKEADCITAVSKGICRAVPHRYWKKVHCVTNGFDRKDRDGIVAEHTLHEKMRFVYTGSMYGGLQNMSPVYKAIKELIDAGTIKCQKIEFCFAGKESAYEIFKSQARKYGLKNNCVYCGQLPRREALRLQMEADVLLAPTVDYQSDKCSGGNITELVRGLAENAVYAGRPDIQMAKNLSVPPADSRKIKR